MNEPQAWESDKRLAERIRNDFDLQPTACPAPSLEAAIAEHRAPERAAVEELRRVLRAGLTTFRPPIWHEEIDVALTLVEKESQ